jgi:hypothetical protein
VTFADHGWIGLFQTQDTDGDGLNDAAEFQMEALDFDWQTSQPAMVANSCLLGRITTLPVCFQHGF